MKGDIAFRIIAVVICAILVAKTEGRPWYIECTDNLECGLDSCCVVGAGRFSLPRCVALREAYDTCRPGGHLPINATVNYPDGESVDLTNVFSIICPCQPGLFCSERTGTCQDQSESVILNTLY